MPSNLNTLAGRFKEPGIYIDLPEEEYFADPSIGGSGIKGFVHNAEEWWWNSPFNPLRDELKPDEKYSAGKAFGKALHKGVLEGIKAYDRAYAIDFDPSQFPEALTTADQFAEVIDAYNDEHFDPEALRTADDIRGRLKDLKLPHSGSKAVITARLKEHCPAANFATFDPLPTSGAKSSLIETVREIRPDVDIMADHEAAYDAERDGREAISPRWDKIIRVMRRIVENDPECSRIVSAGVPEVSVFWKDEGVPCRMRIDWMREDGDNDLKSFSGRQGETTRQSCVKAITNYRYDLQEAHYRAGRKAMRDLPIFGGTPEQRAYIEACQKSEADNFTFIFYKSIGAPTLRTLSTPQSVLDCAQRDRDRAFTSWREYHAEFGLDLPWMSPSEHIDLDVTDFPVWFGVAA